MTAVGITVELTQQVNTEKREQEIQVRFVKVTVRFI